MLLGVSCASVGCILLLVLVMMCALTDSFRYRLKFTLFTILCAISTSIFIPLMLRRPKDWRNALYPAWMAKCIAKLLGVNYEIRGRENIVKDTGCIVLINHQSVLDLCVLAELWPVLERGTVISKKLILYLGTFGLASWLWGTIFIDRAKGKESQETINATANIIKKRKAKLYLFPEGTRHSRTTLLPFKKGAFHLAIESQMPIQPVIVSKYYFLNHKMRKFESGNSFITILPSIETKGMTKNDLESLVEKTYSTMNQAFTESTQEVITKLIDHSKSE